MLHGRSTYGTNPHENGNEAVHRGPGVPSSVASANRGSPHQESALQDLVLLGEARDNPELLKKPTPVVPRMAWRGRITLFAGGEKTGKSTTASAVAAAVSNGGSVFLEPTKGSGRVLYYNLEEHLGDLVRRLARWGAHRDRVAIRDSLGHAPLAQLRTTVKLWQPALVVIDSLTRFTSHRKLNPSTHLQWDRVMTEFEEIARDLNTALLIVHHGRKSDGRYRDSSVIGAASDVILEMRPGRRDTERKIEVSGRFGTSDYAFRLVDGDEKPHLELVRDSEPLDIRIQCFLQREPGASTRQVRQNVRGSAAEIRRVLHQVQEQGLIENRGDGTNHAWFLTKTRGPMDLPAVSPRNL